MMRKISSYLLGGMLALSIATGSFAQTIGLSVPTTGKYAPVSEKIVLGAQLALDHLKEGNPALKLSIADDECSLEKVSDVSSSLADADVIVGPVCFDTARQIAVETKKTVIALNTSNGLLARARGYSQLPLFALANSSNAEAQAMIDLGIPRFAGKPFAILDDGSVHGRTLSDDIRLLGESLGLKPIAVANFRPLQSNQRTLLRRMARSGVEAIVVAGAPEDVVTIAQDMAALNLDWPMLVGEQAQLLAFAEGNDIVPNGLFSVQSRLQPITGGEKLDAELDARDLIKERGIYEGYALIEIAAQMLSSQNETPDKQVFETILGRLSFGSDGRASHAPFSLLQWNGTDFVTVEGNG